MINGNFTTYDVWKLRETTKIGSIVKFKVDDIQPDNTDVVKGKVKQKFPNVFVLDNGKTYTWVDYMLGRYKLFFE